MVGKAVMRCRSRVAGNRDFPSALGAPRELRITTRLRRRLAVGFPLGRTCARRLRQYNAYARR